MRIGVRITQWQNYKISSKLFGIYRNYMKY